MIARKCLQGIKEDCQSKHIHFGIELSLPKDTSYHSVDIELLTLRLLTHVQVSVRCLFKDDQFSLLVWLLLSLLLLCFHIQKQLILHALAINPSVLIELHLGISNMHHLIVGQVGIKIITSITGGEESNPL